MTGIHNFGRRLLLIVLAIGLNGMSVFAQHHSHYASHSGRVNYSHVPPHGSHRPVSRGTRSQRGGGSLTAHTGDHFDVQSAPKHKPIDTNHAVLLARAASPDFLEVSTSVALAPLMARGSAARAPGAARAPPLS